MEECLSPEYQGSLKIQKFYKDRNVSSEFRYTVNWFDSPGSWKIRAGNSSCSGSRSFLYLDIVAGN